MKNTERLRQLIELCRRGEFYSDYDKSSELLKQADEDLRELEAMRMVIADE